MSGREVSYSVEFENDLDGAAGDAGGVVPPAHPLVPCENGVIFGKVR